MATDQLLIALAMLLGLIVVCAAMLKGWHDWLTLKSRELDRCEGIAPMGASRIELADLRERIRKLEAIAAGVDL